MLFIGGTREPGGVHIHTADVVQAAAALGCRATIVSTTIDFFSSLVDRSLVDVEIESRLSIEQFYHRPRRSRPGRVRAWRELLRRHHGSDIVLVEGSFAQIPLSELPFISPGPGRLYAIAHSPGLPRQEGNATRRLYGALLGRRLRRMVAISGQIRELAVAGFGLADARVATCTNWISPRFQPADDNARVEARRCLGLEQDALVFGYLGRLSGDKRGEDLLHAFAAMLRDGPEGVRLIIAGDGWKADEWREAARRLGIARRVVFAGWQSDPARIYHALDCFVLPSLAEGFPLGVMEAMACGVPGLVHPMGSTLSLVEDGVSGFVGDMSAQDRFADGLRRVVSMSRDQLAVMGARASAHIARHHSRQQRLPAVLEALDIALEDRPLPPPFPGRLQFRPWDSAP